MDWTVWNNMFHHHLPISLNFKYKTILHIFHHLKSNIYLWEFKSKKKEDKKKHARTWKSVRVYISKYSQLSAKGHSHKPTALLADIF